MAQQQLWHDTIYDALKTDIEAAGGIKTVAKELWPTVAHETRCTRLRNALNPSQEQKLDPGEVMHIKALAKANGSTATVTFESQELSFRVEWVDPDNEATSLRRELRDLLKATNQRMARLELIEGGK